MQRAAFATLVLASAALTPACLIDGGPFAETSQGGGSSTGGKGGATSSTNTGGTGGNTQLQCGDGLLASTEDCDDGNANPADGCNTDCQIELGWTCTHTPENSPVTECVKNCGNGAIDEGEACDDSNATAGDGCNENCVIEPGYVCNESPSVCDKICGNGVLDTESNEQCDVGPDVVGDGCSAECMAEPGYDCTNPNGPTEVSVCETVCGDGVIAGEEICDDADTDDKNGCKNTCLQVSKGWTCDTETGGVDSCTTKCGDGAVAGKEMCDDGNTSSGDGCSKDCALEHTCGNGIVEATEDCDGNPLGSTQCKSDCMLNNGVCKDAIPILPADANDSGVRVTDHEAADSDALDIGYLNFAAASCKGVADPHKPVLHSYTTGNRPSVITVESMDLMTDGTTATFDFNMVWVYRDCPGKRDIEGCDTDSGAGDRGKLTTGYIQPNTTLYIAMGGDAGGNKGPYHLKITEQPVSLQYYQGFGDATAAGTSPLPLDMTEVTTGDGGWLTCVDGIGSPCFSVSPNSHFGGAFGWGHSDAATATAAILTTPTLDLSKFTQAFSSFSFKFTDTVAMEGGDVQPLNDNTASGNPLLIAPPAMARTFVTLPPVSKAAVSFTYKDGSSIVAGTFAVDDIYVYGY